MGMVLATVVKPLCRDHMVRSSNSASSGSKYAYIVRRGVGKGFERILRCRGPSI